jgi:hypothetical protein
MAGQSDPIGRDYGSKREKEVSNAANDTAAVCMITTVPFLEINQS